MPWELEIVFLFVVGFIGGIWNAIAGGATLFTFPALLYVGLPPIVANATNFMALLPANAAALPACIDELKGICRRKILIMILASSIGAVMGSYLLILSGNALFTSIIPYLILAATALFAFSNQIHQLLSSGALGKFAATPAMPIALLAIFSIYGGYFGAGLGIIILSIVQIMGYSEFVVANSLKNLIATIFSCFSVAVFGFSGVIAFEEVGIMMVASTFGGYTGGVLSKKVNSHYMKIFVTCFGLCLGLYYLFAL